MLRTSIAVLLVAGGSSCHRDGAEPADSDSGAQTAPAICEAELIDAHMHCDFEALDCDGDECRCDTSGWLAAQSKFGSIYGAVLSLEHYAVEPSYAALGIDQANEIQERTIPDDDSLLMVPSLECWYDTPFGGQAWVDACKADVDAWIDRGAVGFKDHAGKQGTEAGDEARWVGAFNRLNGICETEGDEPNAACMAAENDALVYPLMTSEWREVVRYIVEERRKPIFTHATIFWTDTDQCFDPHAEVPAVSDCVEVLKAHLVAFGEWANGALSDDARRRVVLAHLGFLDVNELPDFLAEYGFSTDTSARLDSVGQGGAWADVIATHSDQVLFATDYKISEDCVGSDTYAAAMHLFGATATDTQTFDVCGVEAGVSGLDLDATQRNAVLRDNFLAVAGIDCGTP